MTANKATRRLPANAAELWQAHTKGTAQQQPNVRRLFAANKVIDTLLEEGIYYGSLVCISAAHDEDSAQIGNLLMACHLRATQNAQVTIIDATNAFDVRALAHVVKQRSFAEEQNAVLDVLQRVRMIKTFDFQGVRESIDKIKADLDSGILPAQHLLVFDRLSHGVSVMLRNNPVQGQAILDGLFRSLKALSAEHSVCCVLVEGFVKCQDHGVDPDCLVSKTELSPFFNGATAPSLDLHIHIHDASSPQHDRSQMSDRRVIEIAASRYDSRGRRWIHCQADELNTVMGS